MQAAQRLTGLMALGLAFTLILSPVNATAAPQKNAGLKENIREITSLTSSDYKDLAFLKPILKDKMVVSLGENFHRVAEYSSMKTRLIKYLHEELDFDVIAFESGLGDAFMTNENAGTWTSAEMMQRSIFPIWHSKETLNLFDYIKKQQGTKDPLYLTGYDMQFTSGYLTQFIAGWIAKVDKDQGEQYFNFEMQAMTDFYKVLNQYGMDDSHPEAKAEIKKVKEAYEPKYKALIQFIQEHKEELAAAYPANPHMVDIALKTLEDRVNFIEMGTYDTKESYEFRDRIMADNVEWLMKVMYPGKKVILWAHNDHLAKNTSKIQTKEQGKWIGSFTSMGELLHKKLKDKAYVVGLYMNSGKASTITTQKSFDIKPMPKGSLEEVMMRSGYKIAFADLSKHKSPNQNNAWMFKPIYAAEDGMTSEIIVPMSMRFVPKEQFDGIIVFDKVMEPTTKF
ncbi:erythromycin esterase family protein [Paenibacillus profundus]|uniref:Erythromycin esterase family protein n=1 Tax=Paenibacillus profundus TaxID=1173085 RepID=A0ABS8YNC7_9BACL|nr:erythromycin esterase family protein [Paenibacillus profundus]MCE5173328.1 erythromycin esterase family protein [Paenibacillus profundus]